jgi:hypothetical protein
VKAAAERHAAVERRPAKAVHAELNCGVTLLYYG